MTPDLLAVAVQAVHPAQLPPLTDPQALLSALGLWAMAGMALIVFVESGVLFPFLPGDSLLFTAGLMHENLGVALIVVMVVAFVAAFLGDQVGYGLGRRFGRRFFSEEARFLKVDYLRRGEDFFARYGGRALVLARFVPVVRTYVPLAAGMARLPYRRFLGWNALGAALWSSLMVTAGALLGGVPFVTRHVDLIAVLIVALSVLPIGVHLVRGLARPAVPGRGGGRDASVPEPDRMAVEERS